MKKDLVEREKEISDPKEKIKEKDVQMKSFSFVTIQTKDVPKECSSSRNLSFHPDEHHISSCTNKPHIDKIHVETLHVVKSVHTDNSSLTAKKVHTAALVHAAKKSCTIKTSHFDKSVHTDKFVQLQRLLALSSYIRL